MKRLTISIHILLITLVATLMVGHGHVMVMGHSAAMSHTGSSCQRQCILNTHNGHQVDAIMGTSTSLLPIMIGFATLIVAYKTTKKLFAIKSPDSSWPPPNILGMTQRLRF